MAEFNGPRQDLAIYPGGDLVAKGLSDLERHVRSVEALLVLVASPRLRGLGFDIPEEPDLPKPYEHVLFDEVERQHERGAHAAYNALIQKMVSFAQSYKP